MKLVSKLPAKPVNTSSKACPVSFAEFVRNSDPAPTCVIAGVPVTLDAREFSTGSLGWMVAGRPTVNVKLANGTVVACTLDVKVYLVNSKLAHRNSDDQSVLNPAYLAKLEAGQSDDETVG